LGSIVIPRKALHAMVGAMLQGVERDRHTDMVAVATAMMMRIALLGIGGHLIAVAIRMVDA